MSRLLLSLSIALSPLQAVAQTVSGRIAAPIGASGAFGTAVNGLGGPLSLPSGPSLQAGLIPTLSPSAALTPVLLAPAVLVPAVAAQAPAPVKALTALKTGAVALTAAVAAPAKSADAPRAALNVLFEGAETRPEALAVAVLSAPSAQPPLQGPRPAETFRAPNDPPKPATSIKRTFAVGILGAVIPYAITVVAVAFAVQLGYVPHPNYQAMTIGAAPTVAKEVASLIGGAVMAPLAEEPIFRGYVQTRLAVYSAKLGISTYIVPALLTSVIFVALHETADPLLFSTRMVQAMILTHIYRKEGILAAMAAHGLFNGLLGLKDLLPAMGLPVLGFAVMPVASYYALKARRLLKAQEPAIASGALVPKPMTAGLAFLLSVILLLGYLFLAPNIYWIGGAIVLAAMGLKKVVDDNARS